MTIITATIPYAAVTQVQSIALTVKSTCNSYIAALQASGTNSQWVLFQFLPNCLSTIAQLNTLSATPNLNAAATLLIPGYAGTFTTDIASLVTTIQACIAWVVANFPSSGGFVQGITLNSDGSLAYSQYTPAQAAGLVTTLQAVVAKIN